MPLERYEWDGVERRQGDAGSGVTSLKIATRAAEGTPLDADQMFEDANDSNLNHVRPGDLKNLRLYVKVAALSHTAALDCNPEIVDFVDSFVDAQFQGSMDTLKAGDKPLYDSEHPHEGDVPAPSLLCVKEILATQLTPEEFAEIKKMKKPALQLIPITSMARYVEALKNYKPIEGQTDCVITDPQKEILEIADQLDGVVDNRSIIGWRIAITERLKDPKPLDGEDVNDFSESRNDWFHREFGKKGVSGVDFKRAILLMMEALKNGEPLNSSEGVGRTSTFVNEEPPIRNIISGIVWLDDLRQVRLAGGGLYHVNKYARIRPSIVKDVPKDLIRLTS